MLNPNHVSIEYQAETKIMNLAVLIADTRSTKRHNAHLDQAAKILYYLEAVAFKDYLEDTQVNNIYQCLIDVSEIQDYPVTPNLPSLEVPSVGTTIIIQGEKGDKGDTGGATDFAVSTSSTVVVDSFAVSLAYGARWDYIVNGTPQRVGTVYGTWTEDGASVGYSDLGSPDVNGSTADVIFSVDHMGGLIRLIANVTGGTWDISGSRYLIPNNGSGVNVATTPLTEGEIYIGNSLNVPVSQPVTGDIELALDGEVAITAGVIVNADVNASAAIAVSKLAAMTASRAVVSDGSGFISPSAATATEVGYLSGVTSAIQTQLDSKLSAATGAISTVVAVDLTINRAVISNPSGKIAVSAVTTTELGYVSGVTSAIQTQINTINATLATKVNDTGDVITGTLEVQGGVRTLTSGPYLKQKVMEIGVWNMDSTSSVSVAHSLADWTKIRAVEAIIVNDAGNSLIALDFSDIGGWIVSDATNIVLQRTAAGTYDNTDFDSAVVNRGYITITYEA